jgi:hypothetical protein
MKLRSILSVVAGAAIVLGAGALVTSPAQAAARDGVCESGEFCYYYNSGPAGSVSDFTASVTDYGTTPSTCYVFKGPGAGQGQCIKNNAAAVWNQSSQTVRIYYNTGWAGTPLDIAPGVKMNLAGTALYNENASHQFLGTAPTHDPLPDPKPTADPTMTPSDFAAPGVNPYPSAATRAPNATQRTEFVRGELLRLTGANRCYVGGYRSGEKSTSNHNTGNALDCTMANAIGNYPTASQRNYGWKVAYWLQKYAVRLQVRYVIWDGKIWSVARSSEGWRKYTVATDVTGGHFDHVHVSIQNPYGD